MALTKDDKDWVKLVSEKLAYEVNKLVVAEHIKTCPHGVNMKVRKALFIGVCIGSGIAAGGAGGAVAVFVSKMVSGLL